MNKMRYILAMVVLLSATVMQGQDSWEKWGPTKGMNGAGVVVRAGYTLGGTSPIPLPKEVRSINTFAPKGGATIGVTKLS